MTKDEYAMKEEYAAVSVRTVKSELTNLEEELSALGASVEEVALRYSAAARYPEPQPAPSLAQRDDVPSGDSDLLRALQSITQRARAIRYELDDFISRSQL